MGKRERKDEKREKKKANNVQYARIKKGTISRALISL
jgi:hypothetical protein